MDDKRTKRQNVYKVIILVVLAVLITFMTTTLLMYKKFADVYDTGTSIGDNTTTTSGSQKDASLVKTLEAFKAMLEQKYIGEIDEEQLIEGAIKGYVEALGDPYTQYLTKDEMQEFKEETSGEYVGIGVYVTNYKVDNTILVVGVMKGSPALEAGMQAGDVIEKVDGVEYTGGDMTAAANSIKGEEGSTVTLEIQRGQEIKTFEITRKKITTNPVVSEKLDNNIGYLEVTSFDEDTAENFKAKYEELKSQGITSLIIDLRNNGGGLVEEALKIADYIVPKDKELLVTIDKDKKEKVEKSKEDVLIDMPIVVLVNKNSASSTEILAGALKDLNEATIVGNTTYGKGVIQQLLQLRDGAGLKVTVEEYYTPNRTKINGVGIEPNEKVDLPESVENPLSVERKDDTQLQKAIEILNK